MRDTFKISVQIIASALLSHTVMASAAGSWQEKMLFDPSPAQLAVEDSRDRIMIYNGFRDVQVEQAIEEQFDRIEHMMFTETLVTDTTGEVITDPETGAPRVEDDGC